MKDLFKNKRVIYMSGVVVLVILAVVLNAAFAAFTITNQRPVTNIRVGNFQYTMRINCLVGRNATIPANSVREFDVSITGLNDASSRYELIYQICSDANCTNFADHNSNIIVEYSPFSDSITGEINDIGVRFFRIRIANNTSQEVTLRFDVNAGFIHNTLSLLGNITNQFNIPECEEGNACETILANNTIKSCPNFGTSITEWNRQTQEGVFRALDEDGTAFFFRGMHELNNNLVFGGHQWKILRIESDGSFRLLYNGVCTLNNEGTNCIEGINGLAGGDRTSIGRSVFSSVPSSQQDNRHSGYMFGNSCDTFENCHANISNSAIKDVVDNFFNTLSQETRNKTVPTSFCIDRSPANLVTHQNLLISGLVGTSVGTVSTAMLPRELIRQATPTLLCSSEQAKIDLNAGLIGHDELRFAGMWGGGNQLIGGSLFVNSGIAYWGISPGGFCLQGEGRGGSWNCNSSMSTALATFSHGGAWFGSVNLSYDVRPVISLSRDIILTGTGSASAPFVVNTSIDVNSCLSECQGLSWAEQQNCEEACMNCRLDANFNFRECCCWRDSINNEVCDQAIEMGLSEECR